MPLTLVPDSTTRSVSAGILAENKQPQPLADASGYKVSAIGLTPLRLPDSYLAPRSINPGGTSDFWRGARTSGLSKSWDCVRYLCRKSS